MKFLKARSYFSWVLHKIVGLSQNYKFKKSRNPYIRWLIWTISGRVFKNLETSPCSKISDHNILYIEIFIYWLGPGFRKNTGNFKTRWDSGLDADHWLLKNYGPTVKFNEKRRGGQDKNFLSGKTCLSNTRWRLLMRELFSRIFTVSFSPLLFISLIKLRHDTTVFTVNHAKMASINVIYKNITAN